MPSLPTSLGYFVKSAGARPFSQDSIVGVTEKKQFPQASQDFGLGALFRTQIDTLEIILGQRTGGLSFKDIASGKIGLYRIQAGFQTDVLLREFEFDLASMRKDKSFRFYMSSPGAPDEDIWVACSLTLVTGDELFKSIDVEVDDDTRKISPQKQRVGHMDDSANISWEHKAPTPVQVRALDDLAETPALLLDFVGTPLVQYDNGDVFYSGGGNRYLTGDTVVYQEEDEAPWDLGCPVFMEQRSANLLPHAGMNVNYGAWEAPHDPVVVETRELFEPFGDSFRIAYFSVSSPKSVNSAWFWKSDAVPFDGNTVTGSAFLYAASDDYQRLKFEIVIQILSTAEVVMYEVSKPVDYTELQSFNVHEASWYKPNKSAPISGKVRIGVRVRDFNPGDRFILGIAFPQIEYAKTATTRMPSGGTRQRDQLIYTPSDTYKAEMTFGGMVIRWAPLYDGVPDPAGDQVLFDSRDTDGRSGLILTHRRDGIFAARLVDAAGTFAEVTSASTIPLEAGAEYTTSVYWDCQSRQLRIDINGAVLVNRTFMAFPNLGQTPMPRVLFGTSYLEVEQPQFKLLSFEHRAAPT